MAYGNALSRDVGRFFETVDLLPTPTIASVPAPLGELNQDCKGMAAMDWTWKVFAYVPFTQLFNSTGQPAISLPLHWSQNGLPVGAQFVGRFGDEATLLGLSAQLEEARPWAQEGLPVHVGASRGRVMGLAHRA
jgi:amidase